MEFVLAAFDCVVLDHVLLLANLGAKSTPCHDLDASRYCRAVAWSGHDSLRHEGSFLGRLAWDLLLSG
jgi:hypothetical protein